MNVQQQHIITDAENWVRPLLEKDGTGHDWYHIDRVRKLARRIAKAEGADLFLVDLIAIFHEMADEKLRLWPSEREALAAVQGWLEEHKVSSENIQEIVSSLRIFSYRKSWVGDTKMSSLAGQVAQDADRLEAVGAIGVARCFAYGGKRGRPLYDPAYEFRHETSEESYLHCPSSLHHFTEKLLLLRDRMNTAAGRQLVEERHRFTQEFFDRFLSEWEGRA